MKVRLKTILGFNAIAEVINLVYNASRLVFGYSRYTPKDVYIARLFTSIWMLSLIFTFSSSRWDTEEPPYHQPTA